VFCAASIAIDTPSAGKDERREAAVKNMYRLRALRLERDQKAKSN
jgi:hypothetical protein